MSHTVDTTNLEQRIDAGQGHKKADLVIKNVNIMNMKMGKTYQGDIAIVDNQIVGVCDSYDGVEEIDGTGLYAAPGFIDTHVHIESSLVTPMEFDRMVLPRGTTTVICDPHEMANVRGTESFDFFFECAEAALLDIEVNLSSCVPATPISTSGAAIFAKDLIPYMDRALGLAEVMNIPGVLNKDPDMMQKLGLFQGRHIDGHMPGLGTDPSHGPMINALSAAGISTDHECSKQTPAHERKAPSITEIFEKMKRGVNILVREGTTAQNLEDLLEIITTENSYSTAFCTDDFHPADIIDNGHINHLIKKALALYDPEIHETSKERHIMNVYRMASYAAALNFGLHDKGLIEPNKRADIVLLSDPETCEIASVIKDGKVITEQSFENRPVVELKGLNSVHIDPITADKLQLKSDNPQIPVARVLPNDLITPGFDAELDIKDGALQPDLDKDILKCAVLERHGKTDGNIGIGFVNGFGFKDGAIAASVGHDDHNITVVGANDDDMALAVNTIRDMDGGYVVVKDGEVKAKLALPVAGLMSDQTFEDVAAQERDIRREALALSAEGNSPLTQPLQTLAFISLSVIPDVRICDVGITRNDGKGPVLVNDQRPKP